MLPCQTSDNNKQPRAFSNVDDAIADGINYKVAKRVTPETFHDIGPVHGHGAGAQVENGGNLLV